MLKNDTHIKMQTPSQTIGPFFAPCLTPSDMDSENDSLVNHRFSGQGDRIDIRGSVFDGAGQVIDDALIEIWQADGNGRFNNSASGFTRSGTEPGEFYFELFKPGIVAGATTPFLNLTIFMRGLLNHVYTRMYFSDEQNQNDPVLCSIARTRQNTLIAVLTRPGEYRFDIHMQGEHETVFFDV